MPSSVQPMDVGIELSRLPTRIRSLSRLLRGAMRRAPRCTGQKLPSDPASLSGYSLLSLDIFDTLILRRPNLDESLRHQAASFLNRLSTETRSARMADHRSMTRHLAITEAKLQTEAVVAHMEPEIRRRDLYSRALRGLISRPVESGGWQPDELLRELMDLELTLLFQGTRPNAALQTLLRAAHDLGLGIVAVSDTHYTAVELKSLLASHGIRGIQAIYPSCDNGVSKFRG